ncbi:hypothetical protein BHE74_00004025 [Ensete ventricosum]|nr:hypothetical protein BHE74_00004025 [Ensete ventricosum]
MVPRGTHLFSNDTAGSEDIIFRVAEAGTFPAATAFFSPPTIYRHQCSHQLAVDVNWIRNVDRSLLSSGACDPQRRLLLMSVTPEFQVAGDGKRLYDGGDRRRSKQQETPPCR